jgi:hypothetical protein
LRNNLITPGRKSRDCDTCNALNFKSTLLAHHSFYINIMPSYRLHLHHCELFSSKS